MNAVSISQISAQINAHLPATYAAVLAVEATAHDQPGKTKLQTVVDVVLAGAQAAQGVPIPEVQAIAGLASLLVGLLNGWGVFNHGAKPNIPSVPLLSPVPAG